MAAMEIGEAYSRLEMDELSARITRGEKTLHERRLTPATEEAVEAAKELVDQDSFREAALAWDKVYFHGKVFPGYDFRASKRARNCESMRDGGFQSLCGFDPPAGLRKGDIVHIWVDVTIRVEKIEKVFYGGFPFMLIRGEKHDCSEDRQLTAPWLEPKPLWSRIRARFTL